MWFPHDESYKELFQGGGAYHCFDALIIKAYTPCSRFALVSHFVGFLHFLAGTSFSFVEVNI